jgi:superfamily II DNA or RNA helicase
MRWASDKAAEAAKLREVVYQPKWSVIEKLKDAGFKFRFKQLEALKVIAEHPNGRIDCHTGWGKGTLISLVCMLFPLAKVDVVTKSVEILKTRLYPELCQTVMDVGIIGGGLKIKHRRVMCISAASLHHARQDADFVLVDEGPEACADKYAKDLGAYRHARMWAFSASWDMRLDNKDMRGEAMFGPIRLRVSYQEGQKKGIVVPMRIIWSDVKMDMNPIADVTDPVRRKSLGIWKNSYRNDLIAADAKRYKDDQQVLITVETLEHALELAKRLPDYKVVYSGQGLKDTDVAYFTKHYPDQFKPMTRKRLTNITKKFSKGTYKKAIATTVWNVGVDFRHLEILIRADGGGSPINDVQIPGRNTRKKRTEDIDKGSKEKVVGIVHDYLDQFDPGFQRRATGRSSRYKSLGWEQKFPEKQTGSKLRKKLHLE